MPGMENLRERRLKMAMSQAELARRCKCSHTQIWAVEHGKSGASEELQHTINYVLSGIRIAKKERTPVEKVWHEIWCDRYGGSNHSKAGICQQ